MKYTIKTPEKVYLNVNRQEADRIINRLLNEGVTFSVKEG